jgi:hypothetical protein
MKTGIVLLAFVISCCARCNAQRTPVEDAVASALKWYFRWIMPIPTDAQRIECTLALFERSSFAYCGRISRSMDIDTADPDMPHVSSIVYESGNFDEALADFRRHRNRDGRQLGPPHLVSIPVKRLNDCKVDRKRTADAAAEAIGKEYKAKLENDGFSFRYPLMCEDDAFYLVYFMKGNDIQWIHKFEVFADRLELRWSYEAETAQRALPEVAIQNLKRPELWYKVEP